MGLLDTLFGKGPSISTHQRFNPQDVLSTFNQFLPEMQGQLQQAGQNVFNQASSFGPGFQGAVAGGVAGAQNSTLMDLLRLAMQTESNRNESVVDPGSGGLFGSILGGLSGGLGEGLGAMLLGGGGGGGGGGAGAGSFLNFNRGGGSGNMGQQFLKF